MRMRVLRGLKPFPTSSRLLAATASLACAGCLFWPETSRSLQLPEPVTTPWDSVTTAPASVVVELYEPYLDARLGPEGRTPLEQSLPVRVRERDEDGGAGRVVEFRRARRGFGSWSPERERELHLFLLRGFFLHPGVFDDTTGTSHIDSLYARARTRDPYTRRIDSAAAEAHRRQARTSVRPRVLGIQIRLNDAGDSLSLELVAPESPAHAAGLRRGMAILAVNDSAVTGDSALERFVRFIDADTAATRLTVRGPQGTFTGVMGRDTVNFPTVQVDSLGGAGYIAVYSFTASTVDGGGTADEFRRALVATRRFPATLLDLRGNGGGSLAVVLRMCDEILGGGVIIRLLERNLEGGASLRTETAYRANAGGEGTGRSFVLLADEGSASASEIFIAALRENLDVAFVGARTYGKGVGQASFDTPGGGIAIVTYGTARTASGADYNGVGLAPSHPSTERPDAMLAQAVAVAVPGALARRAAGGRSGPEARRAGVITWNRRQALRPDVVEWGTVPVP